MFLRHLVAFLPLLRQCVAQYGRYVDPFAQEFPDSRNNFCQRAQQVESGVLAIGDLLRGTELHFVGTTFSPLRISVNADGTLSGIHADIINTVAERAGFTYTMDIINHTRVLGGNRTWTDLLLRSVEVYDMVLGGFIVIPDRVARGARTPLGFEDASFNTVTLSNPETSESLQDQLIKWSKPFEPELWYTFMGMSIVTASIYCLVECNSNKQHLEGHTHTGSVAQFLHSWYLSLMEFTGNGSLDPHTLMGKMLVLSYSVFILLLVSAYTATLAAFQVVRNTESGCTSLSMCLSRGQTLCVLPGGADTEWLLSEGGFPWLATSGQLVRTHDPLAGLAGQQCDMAFTQHMEFRIAEADNALNPNCGLRQLGWSEQHMTAGWLGKADDLGMCTSRMLDAVSIYLLRMLVVGEIEATIVENLEREATRQACDQSTPADADATASFKVGDVLGGVAFHMLVILIVLLRLLCKVCIRSSGRQDLDKARQVEPDEEPQAKEAVLTIERIEAMEVSVAKLERINEQGFARLESMVAAQCRLAHSQGRVLQL